MFFGALMVQSACCIYSLTECDLDCCCGCWAFQPLLSGVPTIQDTQEGVMFVVSPLRTVESARVKPSAHTKTKIDVVVVVGWLFLVMGCEYDKNVPT